MINYNLKTIIKFTLLVFLFCVQKKISEGQNFYKIPEQVFNFYEMTGANFVYVDTINAFEISHFITLKEYKEFLQAVKRDSSESFYLSMLPDSAIALTPEIYDKYITEKKYEKYPVVGVSWESALHYCYWRTMKDFEPGEPEFCYKLPMPTEWLAAYRYLKSIPTKNDFNDKYSDLLLSNFDESLLRPQIASKTFTFDYLRYFKEDDVPALRRKNITGSSYVFQMNQFINNGCYIYSDNGAAYVSFRMVKHYEGCNDSKFSFYFLRNDKNE